MARSKSGSGTGVPRTSTIPIDELQQEIMPEAVQALYIDTSFSKVTRVATVIAMRSPLPKTLMPTVFMDNDDYPL